MKYEGGLERKGEGGEKEGKRREEGGEEGAEGIKDTFSVASGI